MIVTHNNSELWFRAVIPNENNNCGKKTPFLIWSFGNVFMELVCSRNARFSRNQSYLMRTQMVVKNAKVMTIFSCIYELMYSFVLSLRALKMMKNYTFKFNRRRIHLGMYFIPACFRPQIHLIVHLISYNCSSNESFLTLLSELTAQIRTKPKKKKRRMNERNNKIYIYVRRCSA